MEAAEGLAPDDEPDAAAFDALKRELAKARRDGSEARLQAMRGEREKLGRRIVDALAVLAPWRDDPTRLADVSVPGEAETEALRQRRARTNAAYEDHRRRLAEATAEMRRLKAEDAAARRAEIVGDATAAEIRAAREAAWVAHCAALDAMSAKAFEAEMRRDDAVGAARLAHAHEIAAARARAVRLAGLEVARAAASAELRGR